MSDEKVYLPGIALDVGTSYLVVGRQPADGEEPEFQYERDAFFTIIPQSPTNAKFIEKSLRQKGAFTLKSDNKFYVVGQHALDVANIRQSNVERPLKRGVLSDSERDSFGMLTTLIKSLVRESKHENEICVYTYPADPIDLDIDIIYHQNRIGEILRTCKYVPKPILEAEALAYSELMNDDLTGICISCGAGMFNLILMDVGENLFSFSISQGGDFIDKRVSKQMGISETVAQAEKESEDLDLLNPKDKMHKAIAIYYDALIDYVVEALESRFKTLSGIPKFEAPIPVVIAGGTSLAKGFLEKISAAFASRPFPFQIKDIRRAEDPLRAVANGALIYAQMEMEGDNA
jgi:hypothetical protein